MQGKGVNVLSQQLEDKTQRWDGAELDPQAIACGIS